MEDRKNGGGVVFAKLIEVLRVGCCPGRGVDCCCCEDDGGDPLNSCFGGSDCPSNRAFNVIFIITGSYTRPRLRSS
jgi:hypothetical protein